MKPILELGENKIFVGVYEGPDFRYTIETYFAGVTVKSNIEYKSPNLAISDARTIFYLLNGLGEILNRVTE
jgi:hypothetical protein